MEHNELKPCPFCGGEADVKYQPIYMDYGVCIFCTECKARSKFFPYDCKYTYFHGEKNVYISKEQAKNKAIELWNRRADNEQRETN